MSAVLRLIRLPEVMNRVALSRSTIYRRVDLGTFPRPKLHSQSSVAWLEHEINDWILGLPRANDNAPAKEYPAAAPGIIPGIAAN